MTMTTISSREELELYKELEKAAKETMDIGETADVQFEGVSE